MLFRRRLHQWNQAAQAVMKQFEKEFQPLTFPHGVGRSFLRGGEDAKQGNKITFEAFFNPTLKQIKMVYHFGGLTEGPKDHVHGGAIGALADTAMGICAWYCGIPCVTGNLNVNYRQPVPLNTTGIIHAHIDRMENRKFYVEYAMKDLLDEKLYSDGTALFIKLKEPIDTKQVLEYWSNPQTDW